MIGFDTGDKLSGIYKDKIDNECSVEYMYKDDVMRYVLNVMWIIWILSILIINILYERASINIPYT